MWVWNLACHSEAGIYVRLRVFKNRVLRKVFGPERNEVMGECRGHYNEELYDAHSSPNIFQVIKFVKNETGGVFGPYGGEEKFVEGVGGEI